MASGKDVTNRTVPLRSSLAPPISTRAPTCTPAMIDDLRQLAKQKFVKDWGFLKGGHRFVIFFAVVGEVAGSMAAPVAPFKHRRCTLERIEKALSLLYFADVNLARTPYPKKVSVTLAKFTVRRPDTLGKNGPAFGGVRYRVRATPRSLYG